MIDGPKKDIPDSGEVRTSITVLIEGEEDLTVVDDPPEMRGLWDDDLLAEQGGTTTHVVIEGEEDLTVIDNPPGFPTPEELEFMGMGGKTRNVEIDGAEAVETDS